MDTLEIVPPNCELTVLAFVHVQACTGEQRQSTSSDQSRSRATRGKNPCTFRAVESWNSFFGAD
eukprot:6462081-Amphidinium_carterae.1